MKNRKRIVAGTSALAVASLFGAPGLAQGGGGDEPKAAASQNMSEGEYSGEIIVTARKRAERLEDVPLTINVLSEAALKEINADNFGALDGQIPNFDFSSDRAARSTFSMRGFGPSTAVNQLPGVGVYVDGVYQTSTGFLSLPLVGVERVEVLKGPQGTLYGRNAYAGAISIITKRPGRDAELHAEGEIANGDSYKGNVYASAPVIDGVLAASIAAGYQDSRGFFSFEEDGRPADHKNFRLARARFLLTPNERLEIDLVGQLSELDAGSFVLHTVPLNDPDPINFSDEQVESNSKIFGSENQDVYEKKDYFSSALRVTYDLGGTSLISLSSYDNQRDRSAFDSDFSLARLFDVNTNIDRKLYSQEVRLQSNGNSRLRWLVGSYYARGKSITDTRRFGSFFGNRVVQLPIATERFSTIAGFADAELDVSDRLAVGAGIRYDSIKKTLSTTAPLQRDVKFDAFQPKLTARYSLSDDVKLYLHIARGFREGGFNTNLIGTSDEFFDNDELWSYELGTKGRFAGGRGSFEIAAFLMDAGKYNVSNLVVINGVPVIATVNQGSVQTKGVEGSVSYALTDSFRLGGNFGVLRSTRVRVDPRIPGADLLEGQPLTLVPDWTGAATATFSHPVGTSGLNFGAVANLSAKGKTPFTLDTPTVPGFVRAAFGNLSLNVSLSARNWKAVLFGRNILGERHAEVFQPPGQLAGFGKQNAVLMYNEPAVFGARIEFDF